MVYFFVMKITFVCVFVCAVMGNAGMVSMRLNIYVFSYTVLAYL